MLAYATLATVAVAAIPAAAQARIWLHGRRDRAEIRASFTDHRRTCGGPHPTDTQGAAPSAKTTAAPCNPAPCNGNEATPS
ncbi:hypothetical protein [Nonomuraea sp. NPDC050540]|uniref:hypothetical protein n=1 Tax=Nonomuraea sp. NPDC050540 TaxID=3364367 RepID=UPI00378F99BA